MGLISLNKLELGFYFAFFIGSLFYSIYQFHLTCDGSFNSYSDRFYFAAGSSWINRKLDVSDREWVTAIPFLQRSFPWFLSQFVISQTLKYFQFSSLTISSGYLTISLLFIANYSGLPGVVLLLAQTLVSFVSILISSRCSVYLIQLALLMFVNTSCFQRTVQSFVADKFLLEKLFVAMLWTMLRCISSSIDIINSRNPSQRDRKNRGLLFEYVHSAAYCLYLPTLFLGPHFFYSTFIKGVTEPFKRWTLRRVTRHGFNLTRFIFWLIFTQAAMHFVYTNAMIYRPEAVRRLNFWAFYGFGYTMGQFFFNKYLVFYGITGEVARAEDFDAPPPPKCIGRIHRYSDMWKHFDRGLYEFLVRYIYLPLITLNLPYKRLLASFLTFSFIYVWHGLHLSILVWSVLNFLGIILEQVLQTFINWQRKHLSPGSAQRLDCLLSVPLYIVSAFSNFYFFGGMNIGNLFFSRVLHESASKNLILVFAIYCLCQVSSSVKQWEHHPANEKTND